MKMRWNFLVIGFVFLLFSLSGVFAVPCDIQVSLVNQDPQIAIPGEEVKLVFQIRGIENSECKTVLFELLENYPISLSPGQQQTYTIQSGIYQKNYQSFFLTPYTVRLSNDALDGNNLIEVRYRYGSGLSWITKEFNLDVKDLNADFEIYVKSYDPLKKKITFEILNIAKDDVQALIIEIPKQENIEVKGSKTNIVGDLDSKEYTTADFEATPKEGEIELTIIYSDSIGERRTIKKTVSYEPEYFNGLAKDQKKSPVGTYIILILILSFIGYYFYKRNKKRKAFKEKLNRK